MKKYCPNCWTSETEPVPCPDCNGSGLSTRDPDAVDHTCYTCMSDGTVEGDRCPECYEPEEYFIPEDRLDEYEREAVADAAAEINPLAFLDEYERKMTAINTKRRNINNAAIVSTALLVGLATALVAYVAWGI